jgi:hypothetical protein
MAWWSGYSCKDMADQDRHIDVAAAEGGERRAKVAPFAAPPRWAGQDARIQRFRQGRRGADKA